MVPALCRDCLARWSAAVPGPGGACPGCGSRRTLAHAELETLAFAHVDCDAFYASVEKADDPSLADRPVIVGGGRRGVVAAACYVARTFGVRSAMPMFQALRRCPDAVVIRPRMERYRAVSQAIRARMEALTPLVEPLSLDEAYLDLAGTARLHRAPPAATLARLAAGIERDLGVTVSVGLSHARFLAKIASELDKPRGFALIGRAETRAVLAGRPLSLIPGVGPAALRTLEAAGLRTFADLQALDRPAALARLGAQGERLWRLARGEDARPVAPERAAKSISTETTFEADLGGLDDLRPILWTQAEAVSARLKAKGLAARTVTLKLKRADHRGLTRARSLDAATQMAERLYRAALPMLQREIACGPFRMIGIGASGLLDSTSGCDAPDLFDPAAARRLAAERASDAVRNRFGPGSIVFGRSLR